MSSKKTLNAKEIAIDVACPDYRGAPYPRFKSKSINESRFEDDLRGKSWSISISNGIGYINWLSQIADDPTEAWESEVKRAFKANGLKSGSIIKVKFGSRDTGFIHEYELTA